MYEEEDTENTFKGGNDLENIDSEKMAKKESIIQLRANITKSDKNPANMAKKDK